MGASSLSNTFCSIGSAARTSGHHGAFVAGSVLEMKQRKSLASAPFGRGRSCAEEGMGKLSWIGILVLGLFDLKLLRNLVF